MDSSMQANVQSTYDRFDFVLKILIKYHQVIGTTSRRAQNQIPLTPSIDDWFTLQDSLQHWANREHAATKIRLQRYETMWFTPAAAAAVEAEDDRWIERATNNKIIKTLHAIDWTLYEIDQIVREAIQDIRVNPAPVRVKFTNPFAPTVAIPNDRTPQMAEYEAQILRTAWLRLKSRFEFLEKKYLVDLDAYSDVLQAWFESKVDPMHHMNTSNTNKRAKLTGGIKKATAAKANVNGTAAATTKKETTKTTAAKTKGMTTKGVKGERGFFRNSWRAFRDSKRCWYRVLLVRDGGGVGMYIHTSIYIPVVKGWWAWLARYL